MLSRFFKAKPDPVPAGEFATVFPALPAKAAQAWAEEQLFRTSARPEDLADQITRFRLIAARDDLSLGVQVNARVAMTHKLMERGDLAGLAALMPELAATRARIPTASKTAPMRENLWHLTCSAQFVSLNAALMLGDFDAARALAADVPLTLPDRPDSLPAFFYRTCANYARCCGLAAAAAVREDDVERLTVLTLACRKALHHGLTLRPSECKPAKREDAQAIPLADREFFRAAALSELLDLLREAPAEARLPLVAQIGRLCLAQRTPEQLERLLAAFTRFATGDAAVR
ncbi:hypothetical protein [Tropicibacter sp. S64]|uniref:hypothetical protein n=1 Tax=Tropicibacter sp. S64 TaxID=3415122 RepID=UPI003C7C2587